MDAAAHAARLADSLGPGNGAAPKDPRGAAAERRSQDGEGLWGRMPDQAPLDDRPCKARRHSLSSSPTKPETLLSGGGRQEHAPGQNRALFSASSAQGGGAGAPAAGEQGSESGAGCAQAGVQGGGAAGFVVAQPQQQGSPQTKQQRRRWVLAEVDRRLFGRILLSLDTMPHHLPDSYLSALQQL